MSRHSSVEVRADGAGRPTSASGDAVNDHLQHEWEQVRRQQLALEKQQNQARNGREIDDKVGVEDEDDDDDDRRLLAVQAQPVTDPFACLCRPFHLKKLGQSYILHEKRVVERNRVSRELVLVGPHWIGVLVTLAILVGCTGMFLHQQCSLLPWHYTAITLGFCSLSLYYLYGVACKDPGIVLPAKPKAKEQNGENKDTTLFIDDDDDDGVDSCPTDGTSPSLEGGRSRARTTVPVQQPGHPHVRAHRPNYSRAPSPPRFCDICEVTQDAYTEHCDDCGVCIEEYDHHCPWMGKCIGKKNMFAFKMFNVTWVFYVVFVLFVSIQNVDWGDAAIQRLHRLSTGEWVPTSVTEKPH